MNSLLISGARILDPASGFDGPGFLGLRDGRIDYFSGDAPAGKYDDQFNGEGLWLTPGLIDLCARLRSASTRLWQRQGSGWVVPGTSSLTLWLRLLSRWLR